MPLRLFRLCLPLLVLLLLPAVSKGETRPATALRNIHAAQLELLSTASAFHQYLASEGDKRLLTSLNQALLELKAALQTTIQDLTELGLETERDQLKGHWRNAARDLNSAITAINGHGFAEGPIINGYLLNNLKALTTLQSAYATVQNKNGAMVTPALQAMRDESLLFQQMSTLYLEKSSTRYGYSYRGEAGDTDTLDQMATRFSQGLEALQPLLPDAAAGKILAEVRSKWLFLEKSFINYNEKTVPYLAIKFGTDINTGMEQLILLLEQ